MTACFENVEEIRGSDKPGGQMNAKRAYEIGLVNKVVPAAELLSEAEKFAKKMKIPYRTAYGWWKKGYLNGETFPSGSIIINDVEPIKNKGNIK